MAEFIDQLLLLQKVTTREELSAAIAGVASFLGFEMFGLLAVHDLPDVGTAFDNVHNLSAAYLDDYFDIEVGNSDPPTQHAKSSSVPLYWGQDIYVKNGRAEMWEHQAKHGLVNGIIVAAHHGNRHFCLGVETSLPIPQDPRVLTRLLADISLFNLYAEDAAMRIMKPSRVIRDGVEVLSGTLAGQDYLKPRRLTPREMEALKWTSVGKTAWETSVILGVAESTVVKFLQSAQLKLDGSNKVHAIAKALRLGLLI